VRQTANAVIRVANGTAGQSASNNGTPSGELATGLGFTTSTDSKAYALSASLNGPGHSGEGLGFEKKR
jgi:hypothetical protein